MNNRIFEPHISSIGNRNANFIAVLPYLAAMLMGGVGFSIYIAWIIPLAVFFLERKSRFVRFHAMQAALITLSFLLIVMLVRDMFIGLFFASILSEGGTTIAYGILNFVLLALAVIVFAIEGYLAFKAYRYEEYRLPFFGDIAFKITSRRTGS